MKMHITQLVATFLCLWCGIQALRTWQPIRELRKQIESAASEETDSLQARDTDPATLYPAYNLSVPIDHFHNDSRYEPHTNASFNLRYWFDASHYVEGGPVIVLAAGETSGKNRLPFLQKGIVAQLAAATHGIGVILEHRYYGTSFPFANLSTESLRFLSTDQAVADTAYFAQHVSFPGLDHLDLRPESTAWIAYGGSYAGAFVAFLRKLYPDIYWGAISSSGVTEAIYDYWQYYEAQRKYAPAECVVRTQKIINAADNILIKKKGTDHVARLKDVFGLGNVTHDDDFASVLSGAMEGWQERNWDPEENGPTFGWYCGNVTSDDILYPSLKNRREAVQEVLKVGGYGDEVSSLVTPTLNFIGWINATQPCKKGKTQDECFSNRNETFYRQDDISQKWRAWPYQYCTEWGYLQSGSGVPTTQLPLISRLLTIPYLSIVCEAAFNITTPPDIASVNRHGGFGLSYPRLAFVDGEADPWRDATPHARAAPDRVSTTSEPFLLIDGAVHHWDENGLFANETTAELPPAPIRDVQAKEAEFVKAWLADWRRERGEGMSDL